MEVAELAGAVLIFSLGSHLAVRSAPSHWQRAERERRQRMLDRLAEVARNAERPRPLAPLQPGVWQAAEYSRYFVPMGLRLDQARRVVREGREAEKADSRC